MGASEAGREARHLGPDLKGLGPGLAMSSGIGVSGTTEEVSNLIVNREKALGLPGGLEPLHDALAPLSRLMRILGAIVHALMLPMLNARHDHSLRGGRAGQFIGEHHTRCLAMLLEQLAQQALRRF